VVLKINFFAVDTWHNKNVELISVTEWNKNQIYTDNESKNEAIFEVQNRQT
jgi:hypothetical protein